MQFAHLFTILAIAVPSLGATLPLSSRAFVWSTKEENYIDCPVKNTVRTSSQVYKAGTRGPFLKVVACCPEEHPDLSYALDNDGHLQCMRELVMDSQMYKSPVQGTCKGGATVCEGHHKGCCVA